MKLKKTLALLLAFAMLLALAACGGGGGALIMTLFEVGVIAFTVVFAARYVPKFGTLGTVQAEQVFDMNTMQTVWNDYDNSFMILLFSLFSFVVWVVAAVVWMRNLVNVYRLQVKAERGEHSTISKRTYSPTWTKNSTSPSWPCPRWALRSLP